MLYLCTHMMEPRHWSHHFFLAASDGEAKTWVEQEATSFWDEMILNGEILPLVPEIDWAKNEPQLGWVATVRVPNDDQPLYWYVSPVGAAELEWLNKGGRKASDR